MTSSAEYKSIKAIQDHNRAEARKRISARFGKVPLGCEDAEGTPICPAYALCKQVKTYERGVISEPLCVLPDDEVEEFAIPISRKVMSTDACKRVD